MINLADKFIELMESGLGNQKKLVLDNCPLNVYYYVTIKGHYAISVLSKKPAPSMASTKSLKVTQAKEKEGVYWTIFELVNLDATNVFYSFCNDMINSVIGFKSEEESLISLSNRYYAWQIMFKKENEMSEEKIKGLFGELYFLKNYMIPTYGIDNAIFAWSGPELANKDFSINEDWYEVKTINSLSQVVKISSLTQLDAVTPGELVVVKTEKMSSEFEDGESSIVDLFNDIIAQITLNSTQAEFIKKIIEYGFDITNRTVNYKLRCTDMSAYRVENDFPRILESDIQFEGISNIKYEILLNAIDKYRI